MEFNRIIFFLKLLISGDSHKSITSTLKFLVKRNSTIWPPIKPEPPVITIFSCCDV